MVAASVACTALAITIAAGADQAHAAPARVSAASTAPTYVKTIGHVGDAFVYPWGMATEPALGGPWDGDILVGDYNNYNINHSTIGNFFEGIEKWLINSNNY